LVGFSDKINIGVYKMNLKFLGLILGVVMAILMVLMVKFGVLHFNFGAIIPLVHVLENHPYRFGGA
jgi:hypothetical protein